MEKRVTSHILFNKFEKEIIIITGKNREDANEKLQNLLLWEHNFRIIETISHSKSRHLWIGNMINNYKYNAPATVIGHSKKEVVQIAKLIRDLLKEDILFEIYKQY